ncbi:MAG: glycosyltransferase family 4 protein [Desulfobacula sp.]|nr:glycosyltransferase family 4 protein [Desulfobacula sp.]
MRILYHHRTRGEDAQGIHITEIINAFKKLGHEVEVVGIVSHNKKASDVSGSSFISQIAAKAPALIYELMEIVYNFYGFYLLKKKIIKFKPDLIYERYALFTFAGLLASKLFKVPLIEEVNAPLSYEKSKYSKLVLQKFAAWCEKMICTHSYQTIVVSTPLKKMIKKLGVPDEKFMVIPNGVNTDHFNVSIHGNRIRDKYNINGKKVLGFVGWFREWHGLEDLLTIYLKKKMFGNNIHLLLVGDGPAYDSLVHIAKENKILDSGVTFTGPIERQCIPEYIAAFDLALQPDVTDYASPIKLFEYISMGKGVIAPDKENITEILGRAYPGLFKARDWNSMGEVICRCADSDNMINELSQLSYEIFLENRYLWTENARKTLNML